MSKSNLRKPKSFNFGFGDDDDSNGENNSPSQKTKVDEDSVLEEYFEKNLKKNQSTKRKAP